MENRVGAATGSVRWTLRLEGLCVIVAACIAYQKLGFSWGTFAIFFFAPDLSFLGYLAGPRSGAAIYNALHTYVGPIACGLAGVFLPSSAMLCASIIWCAHIGFDRALGYGLKYSTGFGFTHLGVMGKRV
jgi:hypothetical protein